MYLVLIIVQYDIFLKALDRASATCFFSQREPWVRFTSSTDHPVEQVGNALFVFLTEEETTRSLPPVHRSCQSDVRVRLLSVLQRPKSGG